MGIKTSKEKNGQKPFFSFRGSASGNRTLDSAVRGRRLDLLTNAPHFSCASSIINKRLGLVYKILKKVIKFYSPLYDII